MENAAENGSPAGEKTLHFLLNSVHFAVPEPNPRDIRSGGGTYIQKQCGDTSAGSHAADRRADIF